MRRLKYIFLAIGIGLLAIVFAESDVAEVIARVRQVGWGMAVVLGLYFAAFLIDSMTWHIALTPVPLSGKWLYRVWRTRMVGEAFNAVIPAGGMGGEPLKAVLLRRSYDVKYHDGTASLIIAKTVNMMALILFLAVGFALMLGALTLPASYQFVAGAGLMALAAGVFFLFIFQRYRITSLAGTWIAGLRFGKQLESVLHHIHDVDDRLAGFYTSYKRRFAWAVLLAFVNWVLGAFEIYFAMAFLGRPVSLADAWIIESVAQLVRTGAFFIPGAIGVQEGAFVLITAAMTGSPALGLAFAMVRRFREILWIAWGFALGWRFSRSSPAV